MEEITDVSMEVCSSSRYVQPFRVRFKQKGKARWWDCIKLHDSVSILIFNTTRREFVLVKQFRPAVYMSRHKDLLKDDKIFTNSLNMKLGNEDTSSPSDKASSPDLVAPGRAVSGVSSTCTYGPGSLGCTYELCAGIVDKRVSLKKIAQEEVQEETGYSVPLESLEFITSFYSSMGHAGSEQTMFYCEVTDDMLSVGVGGGNQDEGEMIDVVHVPLEQAKAMAQNPELPRSSSLCFALMWFLVFKKH